MAEWQFGLKDVEARLPDDPAKLRVAVALRHGSMRCLLYAPRGADAQGVHTQDEVYIVVSGRGSFFKSGEVKPFREHDLIFVEAGAEHRFVDFSDDFAAWVVFWGPEGGEAERVTQSR